MKLPVWHFQVLGGHLTDPVHMGPIQSIIKIMFTTLLLTLIVQTHNTFIAYNVVITKII